MGDGGFPLFFWLQAALAEASVVVINWRRPPAISSFTWKWFLNQHHQETLQGSSVPVRVRPGWGVDISAGDIASQYQPALVPHRGGTQLGQPQAKTGHLSSVWGCPLSFPLNWRLAAPLIQPYLRSYQNQSGSGYGNQRVGANLTRLMRFDEHRWLQLRLLVKITVYDLLVCVAVVSEWG